MPKQFCKFDRQKLKVMLKGRPVTRLGFTWSHRQSQLEKKLAIKWILCLPHYKSPTALSHMRHLSCGISSLLHSVNLILFTVLLVHLILRISPYHSHHLHSHHLSLLLHFTPDLKLISFTNPFLHSHSYSFRTAFMDLNLYWIKGALLCLF